jgi:hypothetical protein
MPRSMATGRRSHGLRRTAGVARTRSSRPSCCPASPSALGGDRRAVVPLLVRAGHTSAAILPSVSPIVPAPSPTASGLLPLTVHSPAPIVLGLYVLVLDRRAPCDSGPDGAATPA